MYALLAQVSPSGMAILVLFATGVSLVIAANFIFYLLVGEVNGRSSPDEQISPYFVNIKFLYVWRRHARLFPDSRRRFQFACFAAAGYVSFIASAIVLLWRSGLI